VIKGLKVVTWKEFIMEDIEMSWIHFVQARPQIQGRHKGSQAASLSGHSLSCSYDNMRIIEVEFCLLVAFKKVGPLSSSIWMLKICWR
jgi:hypothetical protein